MWLDIWKQIQSEVKGPLLMEGDVILSYWNWHLLLKCLPFLPSVPFPAPLSQRLGTGECLINHMGSQKMLPQTEGSILQPRRCIRIIAIAPDSTIYCILESSWQTEWWDGLLKAHLKCQLEDSILGVESVLQHEVYLLNQQPTYKDERLALLTINPSNQPPNICSSPQPWAAGFKVLVPWEEDFSTRGHNKTSTQFESNCDPLTLSSFCLWTSRH